MYTPGSSWRHHLCFLLLSISSGSSSEAASTIFPNQSISGSQTITSAGGRFELGFFTPGKWQKYYLGEWYEIFYLGIWYDYRLVSKQTVVWVANRDVPLSSCSSVELKVADNGNLVITPIESNIPIWSTNSTSISSNFTVAELLDSGNLILRDGINSSRVFWQSFDYLTDTFLPGSTLGLNMVTGISQQLISWKNSADPSSGMYSLQLHRNKTSQMLIQWNRSTTYWNSGTWNGRIFSNVPEMTANYIFNLEYVSNEKENYYSYSLKDNSIIIRLVMSTSGNFQQLVWLDKHQDWFLFWSQPRNQCSQYLLCGPNGLCNNELQSICSCLKGFVQVAPKIWSLIDDYSSGCMRNTQLRCDSTKDEGDKFYLITDVKLPDDPHIVLAGSTQECESACLSDCNCSAYSFEGRCSLWYGNLINMQQLSNGSGELLNLRLAASELLNAKSKKGTTLVAVGGAFIGISLLIFMVLLILMRHRRKENRTMKMVESTLVPFRYSDLRRVTKNFSHKLGEGGFGSVYKGNTHDLTEVAVKKLEGISQGEKQFRTEVSTIGKIHHVNVIRLRGFCSEGSKRLLVYDYIPNGSLAAALFRNDEKTINWRTRYQIAVGIARGLAYLHEKCRECIIHCDVKPENILLDNYLVPKVADFGLAKLVGRDFSRVLTTMRGTRGYLAPEWIWGVAITAKADVYSYGMMLFEIISGRRNSEQTGEENFPSWAATKLIQEGDVSTIVDPRIQDDANLEEVDRLCRVACWCIQDSEASRPAMGTVVQILEGIVDVSVPPFPQSLRVLYCMPEKLTFFSLSDASPGSSN